MNNYLTVPRDIWENMKLSHLARQLYVFMLHVKEKGGEFNFANSTLAETFNCKESRISQVISELIRAGYIELVSFDGRKRVLRIKEV